MDINILQNSPWFRALAIISANIGASFLMDDISEEKKIFLNNCILRKVYLFALLYCGTKDFMISLTMTLLYSLIVHWL